MLRKNNIIKQLPQLSPYYELSFKIKPFGIVNGWGNILHATVGNDITRYGDRTRGVWFHGRTTKLYICSAINRNKDFCWTSSFSLPLNSYTQIRIQQKALLGKTFYTIYINGVVTLHVENNRASSFRNVKVYGSDPW